MEYQELEKHAYFYKATVTRIVDADSLLVVIDRGFYDKSAKYLRLARIDAYEVRGAEKEKGLKAKKFVESLIKPGDKILVKSLGAGSFGRVVSEVWVNIDNKAVNLSSHLVETKHAILKEYRSFKGF